MNCSIPIEKQISIIVPVYNEEKILSANYSHWYQLSQVTELIFVDGGSTDRSVELAAKLGKLLHSKKGRVLQMNLGAYKASGKILLFIHADTRLDPAVFPIVMEKLEEDQLGRRLLFIISGWSKHIIPSYQLFRDYESEINPDILR